MSWFEKKFSRYAIRNLSLVLILCYAFGYLIQIINPSFILYLTLNPYAVLHGQIWRLFTWLIIPPEQTNLIFVLIMLLFYYSIGTSLERAWGTWRYNVYMFAGFLCTIAGAFLMMGYAYLFHADMIERLGAAAFFAGVSPAFSTYYINMSIFLAYAATFPDAVVLLMFILPVKVKWLGIVYAVLLGVDFVQAAAAGQFYLCFAMLASLLNFLIFFLQKKNPAFLHPQEARRKARFRKSMSSGKGAAAGPAPESAAAAKAARSELHAGETMRRKMAARHRCAICGRTELDDPTLEFRYCSKCDGTYEFCQDHLFTHVHAKGGMGPVPMTSVADSREDEKQGPSGQNPDNIGK